MMTNRLSYVALAVALGAVLGLIACEAGAPGTPPARPRRHHRRKAAPAAKPAAPAGPEPANVAGSSPAGEGRDVVLNNCGSCHNLACSAIGQRTSARWQSLKESHKDKVTDGDAAAAFAYLQSHFNDANPEPKVPPKFLQGGCTPF